jgi:hypothetical protein
MNKIGINVKQGNNYFVVNEEGKIIEKFRTKAGAIHYLPNLTKIYGDNLKILSLKDYNEGL